MEKLIWDIWAKKGLKWANECMGFYDFFASNYSSVTTYWFKWSLSREKFVFIGRKRALNEVSQVLWKIRAWKFSNFLHEAAEKFKIASNDFFQKKYCTWVLGQKVTENEFFKFYNKLMHFDKFWFWDIWDKKRAKVGPKWGVF